MPFSVAPLPFKPHRLNGLTDRLLLSHCENNYGGAVRRLNAIERRLADLDWSAAPVFEVNGLKREELIAMNSMILHEVYFDGLGEDGGGDPAGELAAGMERDFGSVARWKTEFTAMAKAQAGGSGWTTLTWSPRAGRLEMPCRARAGATRSASRIGRPTSGAACQSLRTASTAFRSAGTPPPSFVSMASTQER